MMPAAKASSAVKKRPVRVTWGRKGGTAAEIQQCPVFGTAETA
jgi:hypothetical protein